MSKLEVKIPLITATAIGSLLLTKVLTKMSFPLSAVSLIVFSLYLLGNKFFVLST